MEKDAAAATAAAAAAATAAATRRQFTGSMLRKVARACPPAPPARVPVCLAP